MKSLNLPGNIIPILIDDRAKYHQQFKAAGGKVIPWNIHDQNGSFDSAAEKLNTIISQKKKND